MITAKLRIAISFNGFKAKNLIVNLNGPKNIFIEQTCFKISEVSGASTPYSTETNVYCLNNEYPYSNIISI